MRSLIISFQKRVFKVKQALLRAPRFWYKSPPTFFSNLLCPISWIYQRCQQRRFQKHAPTSVNIAVICIGNLVLGGAGKTPVVLALADLLSDKKPHFLTRGYPGKGTGKLNRPLRAQKNRHTVEEIGDEAFLLADKAPTWIAHDRYLGAKAAEKAGAGLILMDDGFQNPGLKKDVSLIVIDGKRGFGNGRVFPAGPLREPLQGGSNRAEGFVLVGGNLEHVKTYLPPEKPIFQVSYGFIPSEIFVLQDRPLVVFAGIGDPEKFFQSLRDQKLHLVQTFEFPDHYCYTDKDAKKILQVSENHQALLVTTQKDSVRLPPLLKKKTHIVTVHAHFHDTAALKNFFRHHGIAC